MSRHYEFLFPEEYANDFTVMASADMYARESRDHQFEREELGVSSADIDSDDTDNDTADALAYYINHEEKATDELYKLLDRAEDASNESPSKHLVCDEALYLQVAAWTKTVSNEIGHMKIAFNSLHSQYQSRVRLEKAKLRRLDDRACRRINELTQMADKTKALQRRMDDANEQGHRERVKQIELLNEQLDLLKRELEGAKECKDTAELREGILRRQNLRLQRQNVLLKRQLVDAGHSVEMSIKQRPRRCSAPSILDLTAD
jgi:hypothetical protein